MNQPVPQPESKIQPIRVVEQQRAHQHEAEVGGVADLVEFRAFYTRDVLLYGAVAGPEDGEVVILLHGFPDFWLSWTHQIRALAEAGYRVIAPDQRGYNFSEKPADIEAYRSKRLGTDIIDILDAVDTDKAHLVGHDWGGAVSWWLADNHGDRWKTVTIANCPHHRVMVEHLSFKNPRQMMRSWYIAFFQLPYLPEILFQANDFQALNGALKKLSNRGAFTPEEFDVYRKAWGQPGALTAMLNWYRAARKDAFAGSSKSSGASDSSGSGGDKITVPLQIIWGEKDDALDVSLVEPSAERCEDAQIHWVPEARHFVQRDSPEFFNDKLLEFIGS